MSRCRSPKLSNSGGAVVAPGAGVAAVVSLRVMGASQAARTRRRAGARRVSGRMAVLRAAETRNNAGRGESGSRNGGIVAFPHDRSPRMKSRAAVAFAPGQPLQVVEIDVEPPRAGEVLVRI